MPSLLKSLRRRLRRLFGRGWDGTDFAQRYETRSEDAWGYEASEDHRLRHDRILAAIPEDRTYLRGFEAGCAEGHLTMRLAKRVGELLACDLNEEAARRTQKRIGDTEGVKVIQLDLRKGIPLEAADLLVFSDVLYYLSPREVTGVIGKVGEVTDPGAVLVFANEWSERCRGMTSPETVIHLIEESGSWSRISLEQFPCGGEIRLTVAVFTRNPGTPMPRHGN
jgi:SAM-dependent methyltransferase